LKGSEKMPRSAREKSKTGIYHVILRGVNQKTIFHDDEDNMRFLTTIERYSSVSSMQVYGWCLMGNHAHLLIREGRDSLSSALKRIGISYVRYYNDKYDTSGHLFQDRYRSESIEADDYLLTVIRYIHQNPVKAGMVNAPSEWKWSSCPVYYGLKTEQPDILDESFILSLFSRSLSEASAKFKVFNEEFSETKCLEHFSTIRLTDSEAKIEIKKVLSDVSLDEVKNMPKARRDELIRYVKGINGITQRQAADILGVSQTLISGA
jgi:REP element-mobilizing transposase RayT